MSRYARDPVSGSILPVAGGGSGGHTILDEDGITYPQRSKLQFEGCEVTDDSTNDITKIKAEGGVTGVKGNAETDYRTGNVNLTPAHVGAVDEVEYEEDIYGVETPNPQSIQHQLTDQTNVLGAKNLMNITASTTTVNGVTFTVNTDKSITVNGTPTAIIDFVINPDVRDAIQQGDNFILTGCPSNGNSSTYGLKLDPASVKSSLYDLGAGIQFNANYFDYAEDGAIAAAIHIGSRQVGNAINKVFYPMIRLASDPDNTYVPYAMTNRELTERYSNLFSPELHSSSEDDLDNAPRGFSRYASNVAHNPTPNKWVNVLTIRENALYASQIAIRTTDGISDLYIRSQNNGTWQSWYKFTGTIVS